jgi:hypothetical protein
MNAYHEQRSYLCVVGLIILLSTATAVAGAEEKNGPQAGEIGAIEYIVLATSKTSTMEKELNESAEAGYQFRQVMGGETSFGGNEVVVVTSRPIGGMAASRFQYKLLATSKTSTMQKELQEASDAGFYAVGQTVFTSTFGGDETVIILERDTERSDFPHYEYRLLATKKTSTLENELKEAGDAGYDLVGLTVSKTTFGGTELVSVMRRKLDP